jgi:hypothetical protein
VILYRVQHTAGRTSSLTRLLAGLPRGVQIFTDHEVGDPSPWRNYLRCLSDLPESGHIVILQDDAIVCRNFSPAVERIVAARPENPICLFLPGGKVTYTSRFFLQAQAAGQHYTELIFRDFFPAVGVIWPIPKVKVFLQWLETANCPGLRKPWTSDDAVLGEWQKQTKEKILVTIPCLVEHPDDTESIVGREARAGADRSRIAISYIGDTDPLSLDW